MKTIHNILNCSEYDSSGAWLIKLDIQYLPLQNQVKLHLHKMMILLYAPYSHFRY